MKHQPDSYFDAMCEPETEPPCIEESSRRLVKVCNRVLREIGPGHRLYAQLQDAAADVDAFDQTDDPRQNGWVGSDGQP